MKDEKKASPKTTDECDICKASHPSCPNCCATCKDTCNGNQRCHKTHKIHEGLYKGKGKKIKDVRRCRVCGCTDEDCRGCIEKTGEPCHWVEEDLCSACVGGKVK